ncbi:TetR/AcrR family transcriptional regulator [Marinobacter sp.]|uniref:TetR/AcrR family transcriptional regulator n=1 Tax=Marinobacter sp. TaxID=50741 RepID=UPI0034A18720
MARQARYDRKTALDKAVGLFWAKGYHGSSMKQIEQALDMRPGSIYATFGNKDGLFTEALASYAEQGGREMAAHLAQYDSVIDGLQSYLRHIAGSCTPESQSPSQACMIVKTLLEASNTHTMLAEQANSILAAIEHSLTDLLNQARSRGELAPTVDCERLARLFQAQIMGLRAMGERHLTPQTMQHLGDDMAAILDGYRIHH